MMDVQKAKEKDDASTVETARLAPSISLRSLLLRSRQRFFEEESVPRDEEVVVLRDCGVAMRKGDDERTADSE